MENAHETKRILLVEDEENLRETLKLNLELEGYFVEAVSDGEAAVRSFDKARFHLLILDIMIPQISGLDVCKTIRLKDGDTPILFLSAKHTAQNRVEGLKAGADDYLVKPFNLEELLLRTKILIQRNEGKSRTFDVDEYLIGDKKIIFKNHEVREGDKIVYQLSQKESLLLKLLIEKENEVVSRDHILERIWGFDVYPTTRTIDNFILSFRKVFEENSRKPKYFHSVRGIGYKFTK